MSDESQAIESWITTFCSYLGHEFFAEVSEDFIEDDFNLTGLSSQVPMYKEALEMILDVEPEDDDDIEDEDEDEDDDLELMDDYNKPQGYRKERRTTRLDKNTQVIEESAELLYGLIHQRYITSRPGLSQMHEKYEQSHFGMCPRVYCNGAKVLPVGVSDIPGTETVKLFCPSCLDAYTPPNSRFQSVDGAFFGTTFGCLFLMTFPELQVGGVLRPVLSPSPSGVTDDATSLESRTTHLSPTSTQSPSAQRRGYAQRPDITQPAEINGVATPNFAPGLGTGNIYEGRIYGFRINERARAGPRMKWLRMKPDDVRALDEVRRYELLQAQVEQGHEEQTTLPDDNLDDNLEEDGAGLTHSFANGSQQQPSRQQAESNPAIGQRKKAPLRRRARRAENSSLISPSAVASTTVTPLER
ncbi:MAG: hypothetical protein Q9159_007089 [Coniocarpon cinnabarinum]